MSARHPTIPIRNDDDRRRAAKACLMAPKGSVLVVRPETRSEEQSRLFHALRDELADALAAMGRPISRERLKQVLVFSHFGIEMVENPLVPGTYIPMIPSTAALSAKQMSDLVEHTYSVGVEAGHTWKAHRPDEREAA